MATVATPLLAASARRAADAPPAAIVYGSLTHSGPVTELRFKVRGRVPQLDLSRHGRELWVDLANTVVDIPPRPFFGREKAPIAMVRAFNVAPTQARIVIKASGKVDYAIGRLSHQILVRFAPAGEVPDLAAPILAYGERSAGAPTAAPVSSPRRGPASPRANPARLRPRITGNGRPARIAHAGAVVQAAPEPALVKPREPEISRAATRPVRPPLVMIDPGHGGRDPGTHSASGIDEKTLALEIARRVKAQLEARGVRAELTRHGDYYVSLPERTRLANQARASLFVSIHLNSSPDTQTTGIEDFYLNNTTDRATIRLARMENQGVADGYGPATSSSLNYILADLRQNYKAQQSAALARMIETQTVRDLDTQLGINVHALGARKGPFYVLVGANMPAVLVECGFLSNPHSAAELATARYQTVLAEGIAQAIVHYLSLDAAMGHL